MKKIGLLLCALLCICTLCACNMQEKAPEFDASNPYFTGRVIEKNEIGCLMEVTDMGNTGFAVGEKLNVNTNISGCPEYAAGDHLRISFDGKVALSYPGQILNVFVVSKVDGNP